MAASYSRTSRAMIGSHSTGRDETHCWRRASRPFLRSPSSHGPVSCAAGWDREHPTTRRPASPNTPHSATHSKNGYPPILFHKSALRDEADAVLAAEVREQIASTDRHVVGVVINAVDDQLLKGEQLDTRWARDAIPVLPALLHEAKQSKRMVVITSDHGHVLDANSICKPGEGGERWRDAADAPGEGELRLNGPRVMIPKSRTVIVPWSEKIRYGIKKNGYHGGVTPQEMVTPIAVLSCTDNFPEGWTAVSVDVPSWWEEPVGGIVVSVTAPARTKPLQTKLLFDIEEPAKKPAGSEAGAAINWQDGSWTSCSHPIFDQQKKLAGRSVPADEILRNFLSALDQRGAKMTSAALSALHELPGDPFTWSHRRDAAHPEHRRIRRVDRATTPRTQ